MNLMLVQIARECIQHKQAQTVPSFARWCRIVEILKRHFSKHPAIKYTEHQMEELVLDCRRRKTRKMSQIDMIKHINRIAVSYKSEIQREFKRDGNPDSNTH